MRFSIVCGTVPGGVVVGIPENLLVFVLARILPPSPFRPEQTDEADPQKSSKYFSSPNSYVRYYITIFFLKNDHGISRWIFWKTKEKEVLEFFWVDGRHYANTKRLRCIERKCWQEANRIYGWHFQKNGRQTFGGLIERLLFSFLKISFKISRNTWKNYLKIAILCGMCAVW